ncbi:Ankyrin repeat domain containing protein [Pandoravirus neocaledonia]|uniref:Ankyrin repeat domain containing protein n=1 Tax=Pandoravirus neocaledonia TaxID=2107708 RepID=A0A2U7UCN7_9VIRU|nr:Ankyrin repeat domain containing protein [Pandoravirus neocaledonia]AVK76214.1 Ankyrin repeat domain containing protein [Pandoravirus neocaledonia]
MWRKLLYHRSPGQTSSYTPPACPIVRPYQPSRLDFPDNAMGRNGRNTRSNTRSNKYKMSNESGKASATGSVRFPIYAGRTPPMIDALLNRDLDAVDALLASGTDLDIANVQGLTPLHVAVAMYDVGLVQKLVAAGANVDMVDRLGNTPLHLSVYVSKPDVAEALLKCGADATLTNGRGTPLQVLGQDWNFVDIAAQYGALVNTGDTDFTVGRTSTPLMRVIAMKAEEATGVLLRIGQDPNEPTEIGVTPLHLAAFFDHEGIARSLVQHGANLDVVDARGNTPLHVACALGHMWFASVLVRLGADKTKRDARGKTPFQLVLASDGALLRADYARRA